MKNNEHTPGPWKIGTALDCSNALAVFDSRAEIGNTKDQHRCICLISELHNIDEQDEANARLIAAAPEMLEALKTVVDGYETDGMEGMRERDNIFYKYCRAAIEAATIPA